MQDKLKWPVVLVLASAVFLFLSAGSEENDLWSARFQKQYGVYALPLPSTLDFAGEKVPLQDYDIRERLDRELLVNTYFQSQTLLFLKRVNKYFPVIEPILKRNGIPEDFKYLPLVESGLTHIVSPKNAVGFWQFIESTARQYGLEVNAEVDERYHIEKSTEAACRFLNDSYRMYGSWTMAAASYNMGRKALNLQLQRQRVNNYYDLLLGEETSRYLFRILALKLILADPEAYGFHLRKEDLYPPVAYRFVPLDSSVTDFTAYAHQFGINYKILKLHNPWLRNNKLTNQSRKKYIIKIPVEGYGEYEYPFRLNFDSLPVNGNDTIQ
jgi:hypothetical protein